MNARLQLEGPEEDQLLTVRDLAALLQVHEKWVYRAVENQRIPFYRVGRFVRFDRQEVLQSLEKGAGDEPR